jgi:hypothetical protein
LSEEEEPQEGHNSRDVRRWSSRTQPVQIGDKVAYSKAFLQGTGQYAGDVPHARGKVAGLKQLGTELTIADNEGDRPGLPDRVNVKNLTTVKQIALGE